MSNADFDRVPRGERPAREDFSFAEMLSSFEQQHAEGTHGGIVTGTIVSAGPDTILVDVGRKIEGSLPVSKWREVEKGEPQPGGSVQVSVGPRNEEGYYELSTVRVERPRDWSGLQAAFTGGRNIAGTVVEQVKGGFRVDVGVRAFMPASRSGVREADELPKLVGQEIQCRITKLDVDKEDVVVDRRVVLEEE
ncbi:MAG: S1 RNA-binding domain-containing protein, partial [Acidobacteriaceae bacterium]|nr:S1 RNA-binding domain-containing protein [Acidobacteriaceae bacterium]